MSDTQHPHGQHQFQVRFDWGLDGAEAIGVGVGAYLVVDVLPEGGTDAPAGLAEALAGRGVPVVAASLRNRRAVAQWVLDRQAATGERLPVAVIAAGERRADATGIRVAVEDLLGAGAVIDALAELGIDYYSPEAAVASTAFLGSVNAVRQLVTNSSGGRALVDGGRAAQVALAAEVDATDLVEPIGE